MMTLRNIRENNNDDFEKYKGNPAGGGVGWGAEENPPPANGRADQKYFRVASGRRAVTGWPLRQVACDEKQERI